MLYPNIVYNSALPKNSTKSGTRVIFYPIFKKEAVILCPYCTHPRRYTAYLSNPMITDSTKLFFAYFIWQSLFRFYVLHTFCLCSLHPSHGCFLCRFLIFNLWVAFNCCHRVRKYVFLPTCVLNEATVPNCCYATCPLPAETHSLLMTQGKKNTAFCSLFCFGPNFGLSISFRSGVRSASVSACHSFSVFQLHS